MSSARAYFLVVVLLTVLPGVASARVYISEVAWMGTADNANAEWIELYNDGEAQDLTGWTLTASDGQPDIAITGTISANSYALLERTSDETVPGVSALTVYTGALGNTGETLALRDVNGATVDSVDGSNEWSVGGDNTTKDTLQRTGTPATGAWTTAPPTPNVGGAVTRATSASDNGDASSASTASTASTESSKSTVSSASSKKVPTGPSSSKSVAPSLEPALSIDIGGDRTVTAGVPTLFTARAHKEGGKETALPTMTWNFGDGTTARGMNVTHAYAFSGEYVVTVEGTRPSPVADLKASDRVVVRVVEPSIAITHADERYIEVTNTGADELDLSGFALSSGGAFFRIPVGTRMLSGAQVRFSRQVTGLAVPVAGVSVGVFSPDNTLVAQYPDPKVKPLMVAFTQATDTPLAEEAQQHEETPHDRVLSSEETTPADVESVQENAPAVENVATSPSVSFPVEQALASVAEASGKETGQKPNTPTEKSSLLWWLLGLAGVILTVVVSVLLIRREQAEVIQGFEIESDE